ncbi:MAG TPA: tetratricopeptide repeat protein [Pyrinomonadaceae bacterium]|nr:tetratricopeptide repeat protein [Pyrinomonadaceae bacterium]
MLLFLSLSFQGLTVKGQDLVAADDITGGGSSVFVFRGSRKKPQTRASGGFAFASGRGHSGSGRSHVNSQMFAASRKKRSQTVAAGPKLRRPSAVERRLAMSNTFAAKGETQLDADETDAAIASFREALKLNSKNTKAIEGLSDALTAKGIDLAATSKTDAATALEEAVKLDSKNAIAYAKLGEISDAQDLKERAIQNYESALKADDKFSAVYVPLGLDYLKTGEIAKAETYAIKAENEGPETADGRYLRGLVYLKQNKNAEAKAEFDKVLALDPQYASAKYYQAVAYGQMNQDDQSIAAYKAAVQADPEYAPAWYDLGVAYYNKGDYDNAAASYREAIKYDPNNAQAHANLASTYRQQEKYPEANAEYKAAADNGKKDPDTYSEWGYCLGKTNDWDKSVARLIAAQELSPDAIDYNNTGWAYYNAAQADKAAKNDEAAKANLEKSKASLQTATEKNPKLDAAYANLGTTNNALGDFEAAVAALTIALSLHNDWVVALNGLGIGYRGQNNLTAAVQQFDRVLSLDGNNVLGLYNMGETQYAMGNKKEAKKYQARLNKINPVLASQLDGIISGKIIMDKAKQKIREKIKIPGLPF